MNCLINKYTIRENMDKKKLQELLLRHFLGETTAEEEKVLGRWLEENPQHKKIFEKLANSENNPRKNLDTADLSKIWEQIAQRTGITIPFEETRQPRHVAYNYKFRNTANMFSKRFSYALVIVFIIASLMFIFLKNNTQTKKIENIKTEYATIEVELGRKKQITLPDKSVIILDAGSKIKYPKNFNGNTREIYLTGEGYFKITHNSQKPFIVHANNARIKVLGTKFNVSAWPKFKQVKVTVVEGKVAFYNEEKDNAPHVILTKGQSSKILRNGVPTKPVISNIDKQLGWLNQELYLDNTPLGLVIDKLTRWYKLEIKLPDPIYKKTRVTGNFKKRNVDEILKTIALMIDLKVKRTKNKVEFY